VPILLPAPGLFLDHELLAEPFGEPLPDQAGDDIGRTSRRICDQEADRPCRIVRRRGAARRHEQAGHAGCHETDRGAA